MKSIKKFFKKLLKYLIIFVLLPIPLVILFKWVDPPASSYIIQHRISNIFSEGGCNSVLHEWQDMDEISSNMAIAVIASEDQNFANHYGFDFESIKKVLLSKRKKLRGASTISQQVARNMFLWSGRSWVRKAGEAYLTVVIEMFWSKRRILEVYLNIAQFGECVYGVGAASRYYYGKSAARLSVYQSSLMAAVLPNPVRFRINRPSGYIIRRTGWITSQIYQLGGKSYLEQMK